MLGRRWCPDGTHLVVATREPGFHLRISTFHGTQLLGSFTRAANCRLEAVSARASSIFVGLYETTGVPRTLQSRVHPATPDGTVTARHDVVPCSRWQLSGDGSSLLGVSSTMEAIFVCLAAAGMQTIDLGRSASEPPSKGSRVSSRDGLAIVACRKNPNPELLFVDLAGLCVVHRQALPPQCLDIAQGSRSAALWKSRTSGQTTVVATSTGAEAGRQLFVVPGDELECVAWDALGRHLAVISPERWLSVYDGLSGAALAFWSSSPAVETRLPLVSVRWLSGSAGLMCGVLSHPQAGRTGAQVSGVRLLRFAGSAQLDS